MDIESPKVESPPGGPRSWDASAASIESYTGALNARGIPATFFVVPDACEPQKKIIQKVKANSNEAGLHLHPSAWGENYHHPQDFKEFGGNSGKIQEEMLSQAVDQFNTALGQPPKVFRAGFFSASNETYKVLDRLGFVGGSTSLPGRNMPNKYASWINKRRDVHRTHESNRLIEGTLKFVDVPVTAHLNWFHRLSRDGDTRLEKHPSVAPTLKAIDQTLQWQTNNRSKIKHICFLTHNSYNYSKEPRSDISMKSPFLEELLNILPVVAKKWELQLEGITISEIAKRYSSIA